MHPLLLQKRIQRDACAPQYSVTFDDVTRNIASLTVSSTTGNCDAGLMVNANQVTGANANPRVSRVRSPIPGRIAARLCAS